MATIDYSKLIHQIIKEQELVIGPIAWSEAQKINGLNIKDHHIQVTSDGKAVIENLVNQYATLFGQASIEVCKDAVKQLGADLDSTQLPPVLVS